MNISSMQRITRLLIYYGFTRHLPSSTMLGGNIFRRLRYWTCRGLFDKSGVGINVEHGAYIGFGNGISIGDYSGIGINAFVERGTTIGSHVMMGPDVMIYTRNHDATRIDIPMTQQGATPVRPVMIGDDVWIGARSILLPGITVGTGSIVGAGSVVTKSVLPYTIVAGNPAKVIRRRIPQVVAQEMALQPVHSTAGNPEPAGAAA